LTDEQVNDQQKELCAVSVMRSMLEDYSAMNHINFEEALLLFGQSKTYQALYDFSTGMWREGPDYLRDWFEDELSRSE
jgi:hypothetical protein